VKKKLPLSHLEEKVVTAYLRDTFSRHIIDDVLRHGQAGRRHVANVAPVPCKKSCQRVCRSAVLQISHHCYLDTQTCNPRHFHCCYMGKLFELFYICCSHATTWMYQTEGGTFPLNIGPVLGQMPFPAKIVSMVNKTKLHRPYATVFITQS